MKLDYRPDLGFLTELIRVNADDIFGLNQTNIKFVAKKGTVEVFIFFLGLGGAVLRADLEFSFHATPKVVTDEMRRVYNEYLQQLTVE